MPFRDVLGQPHAVETVRRGLARGKLHHALLFAGPEGVGKELTAFAVARAIVCKVAPGEGCGDCPNCHRAIPVDGGVPLHPDVVVVARGLYARDVLGRSTDEKTDISVDQIRRVVLDLVINPADGAGMSWLHRHTEVMEKSLGENGKMAMTVRVDPTKTEAVKAKFPAH